MTMHEKKSELVRLPVRIAVFGAESTGKSTLAAALGRRFDAPVAAEYVREFWDAHGGRIEAEDLTMIARGQIAGEEAAVARATGGLVICDTELLTNVLWADLLFPGRCPAWVRAEAEARSRHYALYLLCDTDIAFAPDPQRCFPDAAGRAMGRRLWRETLASRGLPFVEIRGSAEAREAAAVAAITAR
ncbi:MAG: ATP-binding protein [Opitutaceae bacterium]|nr:ATP-binding protein [Opitutaceae bacterium]